MQVAHIPRRMMCGCSAPNRWHFSICGRNSRSASLRTWGADPSFTALAAPCRLLFTSADVPDGPLLGANVGLIEFTLKHGR